MTPTCTGTARSSRPSAASPPRSPATRPSSCPCRLPTRALTAAARSPRSSTSARASPPATAGPAEPLTRRHHRREATCGPVGAVERPVPREENWPFDVPRGAGRGLSTVSVGEVACPREVHRHAGGLGRLDDLLVADRAAGGHDRANAGVEPDLQSVGEREERVGRGDGATGPLLPRAAHGEVARVDPVDLAHPDADR